MFNKPNFIVYNLVIFQGSDGIPQYYPGSRPLYPIQQAGWPQYQAPQPLYRQPQPQDWPGYAAQANYYPQFYQQQQQPQYPYYPLEYSNMDYPVVGYDLAHNELPSFPDVVYMDTSGQYDQSVFQLTQGENTFRLFVASGEQIPKVPLSFP